MMTTNALRICRFFERIRKYNFGASFTHVILSAAKDLDPSVVPPSG